MNRWAFLLGLAFACMACSKSTAGTEMGNPPAISLDLITLAAADDGMVAVTGEPGAVTPGGGEITITNLTQDGEAVTVEVAEDGSFSAELPGEPDDEYELVASNDGGSSSPRTLSPAAPAGDAGVVDDSGAPASGDSGTSTPGGDWQVLHLCQDTDPMDSLLVDDVRVEGDVLQVDVRHSGGCARHAYGLCYSGDWVESFPIRVGFTVLHDAMGDACEAEVNANISFDLGPFRQAYADAYLSDSGAAELGFQNCLREDGSQGGCRVLYEWGQQVPDDAPQAEVQVDVASGVASLSFESTDGFYYSTCTNAFEALKREGGQWVPLVDERPWATNGAHYLDDEYEEFVFVGEGCDVLGCTDLTDQNVLLLEYVRTGMMAPPADATRPDLPEEIPTLETRVAPAPFRIEVDYFTFTDDACSGDPATVAFEVSAP